MPASYSWQDPSAARERESSLSASDSKAEESGLQEIGSHERRSLWNWKPLRALAHIGQQRFRCIFLAQVHAIANLPPSLDGHALTVQFCLKDFHVQTLAGRVSNGCVGFDETLQIRCTVYGSKKDPQGFKYTPKTFILSVASVGMEETTMGKHVLDLSRMLPGSLDDQANGGKDLNRTTSFFLSGKARGGTLMVTFGYEILDKEFRNSSDDSDTQPSPQASPAPGAHLSSPTLSEPGSDTGNYPSIQHLSLDNEEEESYPLKPAASATRRLRSFSQPDISFKHYLWNSDADTEKSISIEVDPTPQDEVDQGVEITPSPENEWVDPPTPAISKEFKRMEEMDQGRLPSIQSRQGLLGVDNSRGFSIPGLNRGEGANLDEEADLVTGEFLQMLEEVQELDRSSLEGEAKSPRALLLKQFEEDGGVGLDLAEEDRDETMEGGDGEPELAAILSAGEMELQKANQKRRSKARAKLLESAETAALMHEWGLNEKAFQSSSELESKCGLDFASSSTRMPPAPPLAQGFGAVIPTRDGGSLRSISSAYFERGQFDGRLVMHVSKPVVVPAEMGHSAVDILQGLAAAGMDQMGAQVMHAMPLDDVTGKSVHQIAFEGRAAFLEGSTHSYLALDSSKGGGTHPPTTYVHNISADHTSTDIYSTYRQDMSAGFERKSRLKSRNSGDPFEQYMSLEELAPVAMEKIEALAMEGLKIQCHMADEVAPYNIEACPWKGMGTSKGDNVDQGYAPMRLREGSAPMRLLEGTKSGEEDPQMEGGLMSMAISLEEWMRLDAGVYDESDKNTKTLAILAAHHATHNEVVPRGARHGHQHAKAKVDLGRSQKAGGVMNDTLTLAMLVQLRDPLRNYEPVGSPMMAFIQAERVTVPPPYKMWKRVYVKGIGEDHKDNKMKEQETPQFKIKGVHMAGLNPTKESKTTTRKVWGNERQHQAGTRWLIANGMSKATTSNHPILRLKQMPAETRVKPGESLWSISARVHGSGTKWPDIAALNPHIRNPNIIFEDDIIRMR